MKTHETADWELTPEEEAILAPYRARQEAVSALIESGRQPERYKGSVLPQGIERAERAAAQRTMTRKLDAEPVQSTMFSECGQQGGLF